MVLQNNRDENASFQPNPGFEFTSSSGPMGTPTHKRVASQFPAYNTFWDSKLSKEKAFLSPGF